MKEITIKVMTPWEAIRGYMATEENRKEWAEASEFFRNIDLDDDITIMDFLDNDAEDTRRLNEEECELLRLNHADGWYIDTFNGKYLK
jgi:hypothetical protein